MKNLVKKWKFNLKLTACCFIAGRINLVELAQVLNVDFSHVESKVSEVVYKDKNLSLVLGQLIHRFDLIYFLSSVYKEFKTTALKIYLSYIPD